MARKTTQLTALATACRRVIARADAAGIAVTDGNVVDLCADNIEHVSLNDIRDALVVAGLAARFPRATRKHNTARPAAKHKRAARKLTRRYKTKARARAVAGGMIGVARTRKAREHFVKVRKSLGRGPVQRRKNPDRATLPPYMIVAKRKLKQPFRPIALLYSKPAAFYIARCISKKGAYVKVLGPDIPA